VNDAVKGYLALASGLTEVTRQRAVSAAKALVAQGGAAAGQVTALADDLVAQSRSNREAVTALVRYEVDKALGRVGLASAEEVTELNARVRSLEAEHRRVSGSGDPAAKTGAAQLKPASNPPAAKAPAKKAAKKAAPKSAAPAKKSTGA
jgi:polyhydroxyalkanoate synthesis regulator phasin